MNQKYEKAKFSDVFKYSFGGLGSNLAFFLVMSFLTFFYTDIFGISSYVVATLMLISRFIDAFTDPIMGMLGDNTRSKMGKYRPWIIFGAPVLGVLIFLLFTAPEMSPTMKVVYAYVIYILYSLASTVVNIPYHALTPVLSEDPQQRTEIVAWKQGMGTVSQFVITILALPLVELFGGGKQDIAAKYGEKGLPEHTLNVKFKGSAGQSFGAFLVPGVNFKLEGEANDYLGKGLSGGRIAVLPPVRSNFEAEKNTIAGNTLLYGATSGEVYINGRAGERFAVRNSGATAVVEGVGDHCCEYMTGGRVVVLGQTGRNFAAGMSGGVAYVWNRDGNFDYFCNMEMVELSLIEEASYRKELHELIRQHYLYTGSKLARTMLDDWPRYADQFIQVVPIEYKKVLQEEQMQKLQQKIAEMQRDY